MKSFRIALPLFLLLTATAALAESDAQKSFDRLKSLVGTWEGKNSAGEPLKVSFRLTAGGSAIMSEIEGHGEDMISMFHLDGDRLILTHYCAAGNQPRMVASASPDGKTIAFEFLDATNLASPESGHMHRVVFSMPDNDHHTEEWVFRQGGKDAPHQLFELARKQ
jgi:hypothetical protein